MSRMQRSHKGAVSLFVVVFTALLITVVTVSFTRLMIRDQQRATDSDMSQSAYDAALAGVEDAKRALIRYESNTSSFSGVDLERCNGISRILLGTPDYSPVTVGDSDLNQAYTCVTVELETPDYIGSLSRDTTRLIPLRSTGVFNKVKIEWFSQKDVSGGSSGTVVLPSGVDTDLTASANWSNDRPPVIEAQLIQTSSEFRLSQFDDASGSRSNTNTLFLYPKQLASSAPTYNFRTNDPRRNGAKDLSSVRCEENFDAGNPYSCSVVINLPSPITESTGSGGLGGGSLARDNAYLRLTSRYNTTDFRVSLYNPANNQVDFDSVQPIVDSTGRASDLFRRVSARIESSTYATYPEAAVDINGNFCKTFLVTDDVGDYQTGSCTP